MNSERFGIYLSSNDIGNRLMAFVTAVSLASFGMAGATGKGYAILGVYAGVVVIAIAAINMFGVIFNRVQLRAHGLLLMAVAFFFIGLSMDIEARPTTTVIMSMVSGGIISAILRIKLFLDIEGGNPDEF